MRQKSFLFIGSSLANGYHNEDDPNRTSMANMLRDDYMVVNYSIKENGTIKEYKNQYFKKDNFINDDGEVVANYSRINDILKLRNDGTGYLNNDKFSYAIDNKSIRLFGSSGNLVDLTATLFKGDRIFKYTSDGNSLSAFATTLDKKNKYRYDGNGKIIYMFGASLGYEGSKRYYERSYVCQLLDAVYDLRNTDVDCVFIQLSTNDMYQYISEKGKKHLPFGKVEDEKLGMDAYDITTSFGAMEYMIAKIKDIWCSAKIVIFTTWMNDDEWAKYIQSGMDWNSFIARYNNYDNYDKLSNSGKMRQGILKIVEKWEVGLMDFFGDYNINAILNGEDKKKLKADSIHLNIEGYEIIYQEFRKYIDKIDFQFDIDNY